MPGMNGRVLSQRVAAIHPSARLLLMSGFAGDALLMPGTTGPQPEFLQKPFTLAELARRVREVLDAASPDFGASESQAA